MSKNVKVKVLVTLSCPTLSDPIDYKNIDTLIKKWFIAKKC